LTLTRNTLLVLQDKFRPKDTLEAILYDDINRTGLIPTMLRSILAVAKDPEIASLLSSISEKNRLKDIYTGGEVYDEILAEKTAAIFPSARIINIFGLTETGTCDLYLTENSVPTYLLGKNGAAPGVLFRIVNENGTVLPDGEIGELQIRSESGMKGYFGQAELTESSFQDGYFRTGDLARIGGNGLVSIVGRLKETISRGGNKIYPQEIETVFLAHTSVAEVLVTGVADPMMGEKIHVAIVSSAYVSVDQLQEWVATRLDKFKRPDVIHLLDALPVGGTGKADRRKLHSMIMEGAG
jgi:long-chain acyl-CoA synthetase